MYMYVEHQSSHHINHYINCKHYIKQPSMKYNINRSNVLYRHSFKTSEHLLSSDISFTYEQKGPPRFEYDLKDNQIKPCSRHLIQTEKTTYTLIASLMHPGKVVNCKQFNHINENNRTYWTWRQQSNEQIQTAQCQLM
eukprot:878628_1